MAQVKLKLVGAARFCSRAAGIDSPVVKGGFVTVSEDVAVKLEAMTVMDKADNPQPIFTREADAKVTHEPAGKNRSLEEHLKDEKAPAPAAKKRAKRSKPKPTS